MADHLCLERAPMRCATCWIPNYVVGDTSRLPPRSCTCGPPRGVDKARLNLRAGAQILRMLDDLEMVQQLGEHFIKRRVAFQA